MSRGVYVQGVSVQEGICPGVTVRGVHVRGGYVLEPYLKVIHQSIMFVSFLNINDVNTSYSYTFLSE